MKEDHALDMLGALSDGTRLKIVRYLVGCGDAGAPAGEIGKEVKVLQVICTRELCGKVESR